MFTYNIYLSTKRANDEGLAPIYIRFKMLGKEFEKSTGLRVLPNHFDRTRKRIIGSNRNVQLVNEKLNTICVHLDELAKEEQTYNAYKKNIDRICKFSGDNKSITFSSLKVLYLESLKERINNNLADSILEISYKKNQFLAKTINNYLVENKKLLLPCLAMDKHEIKCLMDWAMGVKNYSKSHTNRLVKFVKSIINFGSNEGYCIKTNAMCVKLKHEVKKIVYLKNDELEKLAKFNFCGHKLERIRDLFLIQCLTGLSYIDLDNFSKDWIYTDIKGNLFLKYYRGKNGKLCIVPVQYEAEKIFRKYKYKLPKISNQKYNQNLKLLGILLNFDFELTTHVGRKTCGSVLLNSGVSIFTVKTILGHSSVKTTETHYAELNESGILGDIQQASNIQLANNLIDHSQLKMFA